MQDETERVDLIAKECQEDMVMTTELWDMSHKIAYKRLLQCGVPSDELMGISAIVIDKCLHTWNGDKNFGLKIWSFAGAEAQKFHAKKTVVSKPQSVKMRGNGPVSVIYPSDYEDSQGEHMNTEHIFGSIDPDVYSTDAIDLVLEALNDDDKELLDKMLSIEYNVYTSTQIAKEYGISKQSLHKRYNKLKKKMRKLKKKCDLGL